jgi:serine/threonine protein kinase
MVSTRADTKLSSAKTKGKALELEPGFVLDKRYRLIRQLGSGGMGQVFEAEHVVLKEKKAVKILHKFGENDATPIERFLTEARIPTRLKHPNIVDVSDAGATPEGIYFIAMALLNGESLETWMSKFRPEEKDQEYVDKLCGYLLETCEGLEAAHRQNIVHRDLKPANIFLHVDESEEEMEIVPKILDFGVARSPDIERMTLTGDVLGTTGYISPEVLSGRAPDARSDIFALGVVLYEALTGKRPFGGESRSAAYWETIAPDFKATPPSKLNPCVSKRLSRACMKAIERDPDNRFQSASDFAEAVVNASYQPQIPKLEELQEGRKPWLIRALVAVLLLAAAASAIAWAITRNPAPSTTSGKASRPVIEETRQEERGKPSSEKAPASPEPPGLASKDEPDKKPVSEKSALDERAVSAGVEEKTEDNQAPAEGPAKGEKTKRVAERIQEGELALENMRIEEAKQCFEEAVGLSPKASKAWFGLARVSIEEERYDKAIVQAGRALRLKEVPKWRLFLGQAYQSAGDPEAAAREWRRVVEKHPENKHAVKTARELLKRIGIDEE